MTTKAELGQSLKELNRDIDAFLKRHNRLVSELVTERSVSLALQAEIDRLASANALLNETVRTYTTMLLESRSERDIAETDLQASEQAYRELEALMDGHTVQVHGLGGFSLRDLVNDAMRETPEIVTRANTKKERG